MKRLALMLFALLAARLAAAELPVSTGLYAAYQAGGLSAESGEVRTWEDSARAGAGRSLARSAGRPRALRVTTPAGERTVLHLDGHSALWQTADAWGRLPGARTVIAYVRSAPGAAGVLFDGSTKNGRAPVRLAGEKWESSALLSQTGPPGEWQALAFVFDGTGSPLGGLVLGANVATQEALAGDVAEVLIYDRALTPAETRSTAEYLRKAWGNPVVQPEAPVPPDPQVFRKTLRHAGDDGVRSYRIPGLATTTKGTLLAVFDIRHQGSGDLPADIDVGALRSTDSGETWSPLRRIIDYDAAEAGSRGNGVGDPSILVDAQTGTIFVAALWSHGARSWAGSGPGLRPDETGQLVIARSTDDGLTWSRPQSITSQIKQPEWRLCFQGPGSGLQMKDGTLVFPAQFKGADGVPHSCFIASHDHGSTWKISPAAIPSAPPTSESAVVELPGGALLLSMRDEAHRGQRAWARWDWQGSLLAGRWSEPWHNLPDPTCEASLLRHPHGELLFANPADPQRRAKMTVRASRDEGRTWSAGRLLEAQPSAYSSMTVLADGRIGILYETGASNAAEELVFARFPLAWVLENGEQK